MAVRPRHPVGVPSEHVRRHALSTEQRNAQLGRGHGQGATTKRGAPAPCVTHDAAGRGACAAKVIAKLSRWPSQLELQQRLAQDAGLNAADRQLLTVRERRRVGAAGHRADARHRIEVGERTAPEANEATRVQSGLEGVQPMADGVAFVGDRRQVQQLAFGDDRGDLPYRQQDHLVTMLAPECAPGSRRRAPCS